MPELQQIVLKFGVFVLMADCELVELMIQRVEYACSNCLIHKLIHLLALRAEAQLILVGTISGSPHQEQNSCRE